MDADIYNKILIRVERRLNTSPRFVILNALLLTIFSTVFGFYSVLTRVSYDNGTGAIDGTVYWAIFLWSIVVLGHASFAYLKSGAWQNSREKYIQEEILDLDDIFDLDEDDMIRLHLEVSAEIQQRSNIFKRLLLTSIGYAAMWPGMLIVMLFLRFSPDFGNLFHTGLLFSLVGTLLFGLTLPVRQILNRTQNQVESLNWVYSSKRKRKHGQVEIVDENSGMIGDDGELLLDEILTEQKLQSRRNL